MHRLGSLACLGSLLPLAVAAGGDPAWVGCRGPQGTGVFPDSRPPADCDVKTGRNIVWRAPLPNWGHGCPVVVNGRVFVLSEPGRKNDWPVLTCIDEAKGQVQWEREVNHLPNTGMSLSEQDEASKAWSAFHSVWRNLYTTFNLTVVQKKADDGTAIGVTTAFSGAACFDFDGNRKWLSFVPTTDRTEAYARSPLLYRDLLITDDFGRTVAFDKATGQIRWRVETKGGSIATPAVITVGGDELICIGEK